VKREPGSTKQPRKSQARGEKKKPLGEGKREKKSLEVKKRKGLLCEGWKTGRGGLAFSGENKKKKKTELGRVTPPTQKASWTGTQPPGERGSRLGGKGRGEKKNFEKRSRKKIGRGEGLAKSWQG